MLAFDCAGDERSVALVEGERCVAEAAAAGAARHAEGLIALIDGALAEAGWTPASLDILAVGAGPGSFTGVRIAVAAGRGLALALDRPVLAVDGRDVLLARPAPGRTTVAAIDARRGGLYAAWSGAAWSGDEATYAATALPPGAVAARVPGPLAVRGSGAALLAAAAGPRAVVEPRHITAAGVAEVALGALGNGAVTQPGTSLVPRYLRAPDAVPASASVRAV
ncbi:MAG: tRNA (adenosine(37)-N6)-threonylcarbamoyltransferase complex dimerization subunit type 1 TsaB [Geminicoccaceae bacterium]|nr:MAG: tRNA (adenosine(37)-N6)-threonylcarbamoyltransferase complex dimerization subunit type 1 TsaB [Geminicoccaceae bacterium]